MNIFNEDQPMSEEEKKRILEETKNTPVHLKSVRVEGVMHLSIESLKGAIGQSYAAGKAQDLHGFALSHYIMLNVKNMIETIERDSSTQCLTCEHRDGCDQKDCSLTN